MKTWGLEVKLHAVVTSTLDWDILSASRSFGFSSWEEIIIIISSSSNSRRSSGGSYCNSTDFKGIINTRIIIILLLLPPLLLQIKVPFVVCLFVLNRATFVIGL
jgi:hypothetical protein